MAMEKIMEIKVNKIDEVKGVLLEGKEWIKPTEKAKGYLSKDWEGKNVEVTIENGMIAFIKLLGGSNETRNQGEVVEMLKSLNLNLGNIALILKLQFLHTLTTDDKGKSQQMLKVKEHLESEAKKYLEYLDKISLIGL